MSLQAYYQDFCRGFWADPDARECACRGSGYALSDVDTWHKCRYHHVSGQPHPEDEPVRDEAADDRSEADIEAAHRQANDINGAE